MSKYLKRFILLLLIFIPIVLGFGAIERFPIFVINVITLTVALRFGQGRIAIAIILSIILLNPFISFNFSNIELWILYIFTLFTYIMFILTKPAEYLPANSYHKKIISSLEKFSKYLEGKIKDSENKKK